MTTVGLKVLRIFRVKKHSKAYPLYSHTRSGLRRLKNLVVAREKRRLRSLPIGRMGVSNGICSTILAVGDNVNGTVRLLLQRRPLCAELTSVTCSEMVDNNWSTNSIFLDAPK